MRSHSRAVAPTVTMRIAALEAELQALRQQQRAELRDTIVSIIGPNVVFSARELWEHRAVSRVLEQALSESGIHSPRQLGKKLRALCGHGLASLGREPGGSLWVVQVREDLH